MRKTVRHQCVMVSAISMESLSAINGIRTLSIFAGWDGVVKVRSSRLLKYWFDGQKSPNFQAMSPLTC